MIDLSKNKEFIVLASDENFASELKNRCAGDIYVSDNEEDVLSALDAGNCRLLLCEESYPDGRVMDLCKKIKSSHKFRHVPVIVLSYNFNDESGDYFNAGAESFLFQPTFPVLEAQAYSVLKNREYLRDYYIGGRFEDVHPDSDADSEFFGKLKSYVESNLDRPELSVPIIASALNMSASNLFRRIQQVTGMTPNSFLNEMRMARSVSLLKENRYEISEIGLMVGFSSHSYFSKCFKVRFGMTPKEFLAQNRNIINQNEKE